MHKIYVLCNVHIDIKNPLQWFPKLCLKKALKDANKNKALSVYSSEKTKKAMTDYVEGVVANRRKEIEALLSTE